MKRDRRPAADLSADDVNYAYTLAEIEQVIYKLAADGLIYDTGERRWSERAGRHLIVWVAVPEKLN